MARSVCALLLFAVVFSTIPIGALATPSVAHAEVEDIYMGQINQYLYTHRPIYVWHSWLAFWFLPILRPYALLFHARNVMLRYKARVVDDASGREIACGSTVPTGTNIRFEFVPHEDEDIRWNVQSWSYWWGWWWHWHHWRYWNLWQRHGWYKGQHDQGEWQEGATQPQLQCHPRYYHSTRWFFDHHVNLSMNPPEKTVAGLGGLSCDDPGADGNVRCSAPGTQTVNAQFQFGETYGKFYGWHWLRFVPGYWRSYFRSQLDNEVLFNYQVVGNHICYGIYTPAVSVQDPHPVFQVDIPARSISCEIHFRSPNEPPSAPVISGADTVLSGSSAQFEFTSTDPNGDGIQYAIDWDADGEVDERSPNGSYAASGETVAASHAWAGAGEHVFNARAEDEHASISGWSSYVVDVIGEPSVSISAGSILISYGDSTTLTWASENTDSCIADGDWAGNKATSGSEDSGAVTGDSETFTLICENELAEAQDSVIVSTYQCGDLICHTEVESCTTCPYDCGGCGDPDPESDRTDVFLDYTESPVRVQFGGGEVGE